MPHDYDARVLALEWAVKLAQGTIAVGDAAGIMTLAGIFHDFLTARDEVGASQPNERLRAVASE